MSDHTIQGYGVIGQSGYGYNGLSVIQPGNHRRQRFGRDPVPEQPWCIHNSGLLEATSGGTLAIYNNIANTGGQYHRQRRRQQACSFTIAVITGGTLNSLNGGTFGVGVRQQHSHPRRTDGRPAYPL